MGEKILQILMVIVVAGGLSAIIMLVQRRKNKEAWSGTVTDIRRYQTQDADWNTRDYITIRIRRDDGQDRSLDVDASSYPFWFSGLKPGDRLLKPSGAGMPQRVEAARR
jgi:hypothetical protein